MPVNRQFLIDWIALLAGGADIDEVARIKDAVDANFQQPLEHRRLRHLAELFRGAARPSAGDLWSRLRPWWGDGERAWLFDNERDRIDLTAEAVGFDITSILDDPAMRTPAMMYLFHRVEERLDGTAAIIVVDEGWKALDDDVFVRRIKDWEKTIRKRNGIVAFATQSAQDALESRIASAIIEQAATQIFMANPKARAADYIEGFGLTPHEFELVRTLPDNAHCFLIKHGAESVVARLNLTGEDKILTILSGRERTVRLLDEIRAETGDDPELVDPAPDGAGMIAVCPAAPAGRRLRAADARLRRLPGAGDRRRRLSGAGRAGIDRCRCVLTGLLTLFVALLGYRMLFGQTPAVRDGVLALVKIGIVLALATSWTAYRTLIYDVALRGPAELAADIGRPAALPGAGGGLVDRLGYRRPRVRAARDRRHRPADAPPASRAARRTAAGAGATPEMFPGFNSCALGGARIAYPDRRARLARAGPAGRRAAARARALLHRLPAVRRHARAVRRLAPGARRRRARRARHRDRARRRAGPARALARRPARPPLCRASRSPARRSNCSSRPCCSRSSSSARCIGAARVAFGFRMPPAWRSAPAQVARGAARRAAAVRRHRARGRTQCPAEGRSRAAAVVDAVNASPAPRGGRRRPRRSPPGRGEPRPPHPAAGHGRTTAPRRPPVPLGQSFRRRTTTRVSASAGRRDIVR